MNSNKNLISPKTLDDIVGQNHLKPLLSKIIETKNNASFIFYGQPGVGKTSVALVLARALGFKFDTFNPTIHSKKDLLDKITTNDLLIIDEIHALNKDKQDILLTYLEEKSLVIYATTTANPYFKVNPAIRSRMHILQFDKISKEDMLLGIKKLIEKKQFSFGMSDQLLSYLVQISTGDYRNIINNMILLDQFFPNQNISIEEIKLITSKINFNADEKSDEHFNNLSAFHKSLRGSDVDAALYYGALIIQTGDIEGLSRRMLAVAYEDIGLANGLIGTKVENALKAFERLGLPEGYLPIGFAIAELALSPKSNSTYIAFQKAFKIINNGGVYQIPKHLRDAHYSSAHKLGNGIGYQYPHDFPNNYVEQVYLPVEIQEKIFEFGKSINEQKYKEYWDKIKNIKR